MKFVRIFRSGEEYDPRSHKVAVWKCDVCGHEHWDDHIQEASYNKMAEKKCPKCGSLSVEDRIHALKLRLPELERKKTDIEKEIDAVCAEIEARSIITLTPKRLS